MKKYFLISILGLLVTSCKKGEEAPFYVDPEAKQISVEQVPEDIKIPSSLWDSIEAMASGDVAPAGGGHGAPAAPAGGEHGAPAAAAGGEHGAPAEAGHGEANAGHGAAAASASLVKVEKESVSIPVVFASVGVYLKEKTEKALAKSAYHIELPKGGGEIDLARLTGDKNGSFYLAFDLASFAELTDLKVYFVSEARKRKVDEEILGMGCNKFVDITSAVTKAQKEKGLVINTTRLRHVSILGGHFVFVAKKEKQVFLTRVSFKDSNNPQLFCEREI